MRAWFSTQRMPAAALSALVLVAGGAAVAADVVRAPGPSPDGTGVTPNGWRITPAGAQSPLGAGPLAIAATPDGALLLVEDAGFGDHALLVVDPKSGTVRQKLAGASDGSRGYYLGLAISPDGSKAYASDGAGNGLHTFAISAGGLSEGVELPLPSNTWPAGIAISPDGSRVYAAGNLSDSLLSVDPTSGAVRSVAVGHLPYAVALSRDGARAYVSNWGATTVSVVDTASLTVVSTLSVGSHPSAIAASSAHDELYVADTDSDEVSVIDSRTSRVVRTIDLRPYPGAPTGQSPNALALSPDDETLYVANAGSNDVAVVDLGRGLAPARVIGLIPTGWYPSGVALDPNGSTLYVTNMKGLGIGPVRPDQYIGAMLAGTLSRIPVPTPSELAFYTRQVWRNIRLFEGSRRERAREVIPERIGDPSAIRHVIYVLKENRTYDQVLGDLGRGNGDPSYAIFGADVTPNHHELARRFVTFDAFYCDGEVSADGWTWSNAANANTYNQKNWPLDYGYSGRLYDFGGFGDSETAAFPGPDAKRAFLWDRLAEHHVSYQNYGFFVNTPPVVDASMVGLVGHTDSSYPGWGMDVPDQARMDRWLAALQGYEASGQMPTFQFVYLPRDHTVGTSPGSLTPRAMVADNDLALGRLIEGISHSSFWASTAVFVIEDDAQDGPDHVDGHRTVAFAISPYTQTGQVDSTLYSTVSMLRTMELLVGLGPLTIFDALATPMGAAFVPTPNLRPYDALPARISLTELTPNAAPLANASAKLDFSAPDSADHRVLNEAIWKSVKGPESVLPDPRSRLRL